MGYIILPDSCIFLVHESGERLPEGVGEEMGFTVGSGDSPLLRLESAWKGGS